MTRGGVYYLNLSLNKTLGQERNDDFLFIINRVLLNSKYPKLNIF